MIKLNKLNKELRYQPKKGLIMDSLTERVMEIFNDPTLQTDLLTGYSVVQNKYMIPNNLEEGVSEYRHLYGAEDIQTILNVHKELYG
jgi:hypothetical protein